MFVPAEAGAVAIGRDGTMVADGQPIARIGLYEPADATTLRHETGTLFEAPELQEAANPGVILQGRLEGANVSPMAEIARMIEVTRAYEAGQTMLEREDERIRGVVDTLGRR